MTEESNFEADAATAQSAKETASEQPPRRGTATGRDVRAGPRGSRGHLARPVAATARGRETESA